jgi:hypothetical protein
MYDTLYHQLPYMKNQVCIVQYSSVVFNARSAAWQSSITGSLPDNGLWSIDEAIRSRTGAYPLFHVLRLSQWQGPCKVENISFSLAQDGHILGYSLGMCPHLHWRAAQVSLSSNFAPVKRLCTSREAGARIIERGV